ncbi:MAG TPA: hypothetical protein VFA35_07465 [Burkholderiaceae bacterium]|nr:hypothetical protein [Burkholderiaceae bacterium]
MRGLTAVPIEPLRIAALLLVACAATAAWGQATGPTPIFTCTDASGKRFTADRPIPECNARDQRMLNADGSVKRVRPPALTADERAVAEERERQALAERARQQEAVRRDRNLLARFPNEAAHRKARELALDDVRKSLRQSEARLAALANERKPLTSEAEFYVGKPLPLKLKLALDANDASVDAQQSLVQNQQIEALRIEKRYDSELDRLKKLWAGAPPGSLGVLTPTSSSAAR